MVSNGKYYYYLFIYIYIYLYFYNVRLGVYIQWKHSEFLKEKECSLSSFAHSHPLIISPIYRTLEHYLFIKYLPAHTTEHYGTLQNITLLTTT